MDRVKTQRKTLKFIRRFVHFATSRIKLIYDPRVPSSPDECSPFVVPGLGHTCSRRSQTGNTAKLDFKRIQLCASTRQGDAECASFSPRFVIAAGGCSDGRRTFETIFVSGRRRRLWKFIENLFKFPR